MISIFYAFNKYLRAPTVKVSDKVMIPQEEHPDINFVGLLIGPHLTHDYHRIVTKRLKTTMMMRRCKLINDE